MNGQSILKYQLAIIGSTQNLLMRENGAIISVQSQRGVPTLWEIGETSGLLKDRKFIVVGTGQIITRDAKHVGTVLTDDGAYVWHILEVEL